MQVIITMRYPLTAVRLTCYQKRQELTNMGEDVEKRDLLCTVVSWECKRVLPLWKQFEGLPKS